MLTVNLWPIVMILHWKAYVYKYLYDYDMSYTWIYLNVKEPSEFLFEIK